jgi:dTDP-4-dehydrorhamnose 3,5-epimerase
LKNKPTQIPDVLLIHPEVHGDARGFLMETYREEAFIQAGLRVNFVQDNHSLSTLGVLRGLHYQIRQPQAKLVRVVVGEIYDIAVDLRRSSATFGRWVGVNLSAENKLQLYIPAGFAHGFLVLSPQAEVLYKASDYYAPEWDRTLLWNDPTLGISWPLQPGQNPIISRKDSAGKQFAEAETYA